MAENGYALNLGMTEVAGTGQGHTYLFGTDSSGDVLFEIHGQPTSFLTAATTDNAPIIIEFKKDGFRAPLDTVPLVTGLTQDEMNEIQKQVLEGAERTFSGAEYQVPRQQAEMPALVPPPSEYNVSSPTAFNFGFSISPTALPPARSGESIR